MKKSLSRLLTLVIVCCMIAAFYTPVNAASAGVHFNDPSVIVGNSVTVSISIGPDVSYYNISLSYDSSLLQYVSSSGNSNFYCDGGAGNSIVISDYASSGSMTFNCSLTFKALAVGQAKINVGYCELIDTNGDAMESTLGNSTVTITNPPTASSDATLKALSISPGTLSPAFSSSTTNYKATVQNSVTSIAVSATKNDSKASFTVSGASNLSVGTNNVKVTVTAEDGSTKTYTIVVTRNQGTVAPEKPPQKPDDTETPIVQTEELYVLTTDGKALRVREVIEDLSIIPAGFSVTPTLIENKEIDGVSYGENAPVYVYLYDEKDESESFGALYTVNADSVAEPLVFLKGEASELILVDLTLTGAPNGYEAGKVTIDEKEYAAYVPTDTEAEEHYLLPCINADGIMSLYVYDPSDATFQRFGLISVPEPEPKVVEVPVEVEAEPKIVEVPAEVTMTDIMKNKTVLFTAIGAGVLMILLIALAIVLYIMYSRKSKACKIMANRRNVTVDDIFSTNE